MQSSFKDLTCGASWIFINDETKSLEGLEDWSHWIFSFWLLGTKTGPILDLRLNIKWEYAQSWSRQLSSHVTICNICSVNQNFGMKPVFRIAMYKTWLLHFLLLNIVMSVLVGVSIGNLINRAEKQDWGSDSVWTGFNECYFWYE